VWLRRQSSRRQALAGVAWPRYFKLAGERSFVRTRAIRHAAQIAICVPGPSVPMTLLPETVVVWVPAPASCGSSVPMAIPAQPACGPPAPSGPYERVVAAQVFGACAPGPISPLMPHQASRAAFARSASHAARVHGRRLPTIRGSALSDSRCLSTSRSGSHLNMSRA
jgi:hypothetical protein